uniref:class I SAM-dependent methyltransferase n=1 Tax=Algoriphagus sp. TaxID=1872435 RepID=UPI00404889BA
MSDSNTYFRPEKIDSSMGGNDDVFDERLSQVLELLDTVSFDGKKNVLDIGIGKAQIAKWFTAKGFEVTGTGLEISSYGINVSELQEKQKIKIVECNVEKMPFEDNSFDIILMSHILEHCYNVGLALQEVKRVLSSNGVLCIFVPPHDDFVCSGHFSMGWNLGQLMYVLLLNGFSIKDGKFAEYGYNVSAVVRKGVTQLPVLRGDRGDIHILDGLGYLPLPIASKDGLNDNFFGRVRSINWDIETLVRKENRTSKNKPLFFFLSLIPHKIKFFIAVKLYGLSRKMALNLKTTKFQSPN